MSKRKITMLERKLLNLFAIILMLVVPQYTFADVNAAVLYPNMREPYRTIFNDIVSGIGSKIDGRVDTYELQATTSSGEVEAWLDDRKPDILISLGSGAIEFTEGLNTDLKVVAGAAFFSNLDVTETFTGISLTPSPDKLFERLKELVPGVRTVDVIYHEETNGWLIELAREHAKRFGLEINAVEASDVREAALRYRDLLREEGDHAKALWLLQGDPTLDERGLLPTILSKAWSQNIIVFSSNPQHVKRGALFSLYPDNFAMGESLAEKATQVAEGNPELIEPLSDLSIAVNIRTAEHLELKLSRAQERTFDLIFPNR